MDEGPGIKKLFGEPVNMADTTRERELGRIPTAHIPYALYSAIQEKDGRWTRPFFTSSADEYSDEISQDWVEDMEESGHAMMTDPTMDTPLTQLEPDDYRPRTVWKRAKDQAAPVVRMLVGDTIYRGSNTPSRPTGKTRLASSSPASAMTIAGVSSSVERATRHLHLLKMGPEVKDTKAAR